MISTGTKIIMLKKINSLVNDTSKNVQNSKNSFGDLWNKLLCSENKILK